MGRVGRVSELILGRIDCNPSIHMISTLDIAKSEIYLFSTMDQRDAHVKIKVQVSSLISSLNTHQPTPHCTPWSLHIKVNFFL